MFDIKAAVLEEIQVKNEVRFAHLLANSIKTVGMLNNMKLDNPVIEVKLQIFLKGIEVILSEVSKKEKMEHTVKIITVTFQKLGFEISDEEAFVLYEIRNLGRFRLKDSKLFEDLTKSWKTYPKYEVEKSELKTILNELKNIKFIEGRRGSIMLGENIVVDIQTLDHF